MVALMMTKRMMMTVLTKVTEEVLFAERAG